MFERVCSIIQHVITLKFVFQYTFIIHVLLRSMTVIISSNTLSVFLGLTLGLLYLIKLHTGGKLLYLKVNWWAKKL